MSESTYCVIELISPDAKLHCTHQELHSSLEIVVQRSRGQVTSVAKVPVPVCTAQWFWRCSLRNAVTCLSQGGCMPSRCKHGSCLMQRGTSDSFAREMIPVKNVHVLHTTLLLFWCHIFSCFRSTDSQMAIDEQPVPNISNMSRLCIRCKSFGSKGNGEQKAHGSEKSSSLL